MKESKKWIILGIALLGICVIVTTGCDKHLRYKTLTFFFTGVPSPYESEKTLETASESVNAKTKKRKRPLVTQAFIHGPYAAKQCYHCHIVKESPKKANQNAGAFPNLESLPGKLLMPIKDLCVDCHVTKAVESSFTNNLWIHGPVSYGRCTICHHHHLSRSEYMLKKKDSIELCNECHLKSLRTNTEDHTSGKQCISCHNAHVGKDRFLLKKDYNEIY